MNEVRISELLTPSFQPLHYELRHEQNSDYWLKGGRGSTKSTFVSIQILLGMLRDPDANAVVARRYQNELRDTVYGQFQWSAGKLGMEAELNFQISPMQIVFRKTGQRIVFRGADNPLKLKSINLGRGYIKYAWFEEVDQFSGMEEIRNIIQSLFRGEDKNRVSFFSFNPPKSGRSWVNQEVKTPVPGRRVHHSDYRDVPRSWLGERFIADAEHLRTVNETAYKHEYLGEEVGTGLEIFNNVSLERIDPSEFDRVRQGLDFGYAVDPLCFVRCHYDKTRRRLYIFGEISGLNIFNRALYEKLEQKGYHREDTIADSAEPKSIDELRSYGMRVRGAKKGPGSVEHGIKFLQELEQIVIDPETCPRAAKEFTNYALDVARGGEVRSRFPDRDNHAIDAVRYALSDDMVDRRLRASQSIY